MRLRISLALIVLSVSLPLFAANYVLTAPRWGSAQAGAVAAAGGTVTFAHDATGIATVASDDPAFAERAKASGAFRSVAQDRTVKWETGRVDTEAVEIEAHTAPVTGFNETFSNLSWLSQAVQAQGAWAAGYTGRGVRIAVLSGGLHATHIDLRNNVDTARSKSFVPGQPYNSDAGTFWNGTHLAGVIAAADNDLGTIGIAPEATIIGVKVIHDVEGELGWLISGLLYAADSIEDGGAGADIICVGVAQQINRRDGDGAIVSAMARAVNYAMSRGALVISPAGGGGMNLAQPEPPEGPDHDPEHPEEEEEETLPFHKSRLVLPAESGSGIAVSATGPAGRGFGNTDYRRPAEYSNYGEGVIWVAGPGGDQPLEASPEGQLLCSVPRFPTGTVTQRCWFFDQVISTTRGGGTSTTSYGFASGTSVSAAAVSAVAALIKQAHPNASPAQLKSILARTADDEGRRGVDEFYGHGFVNAGNAVK
jgi:lantibiotic leader peptide-processing serine protease